MLLCCICAYPFFDMFQHFLCLCLFADESGALLFTWQCVQTHGLNTRANNVDFDSLENLLSFSYLHHHLVANQRVVGGKRSNMNERPM